MTSAVLARKYGQNLLGVYLNDHLADGTGGVELARRMADLISRARRQADLLEELRVRAADKIARPA